MKPTQAASHSALLAAARIGFERVPDGAAVANRSSRSPSASPPTSSKRSVVVLINSCKSSSHFASGQFLLSLPLPGCTASQRPGGGGFQNALVTVNRGVASGVVSASCSSGFKKTSVACNGQIFVLRTMRPA